MSSVSRRPPQSLTSLSRAVAAKEIEVSSTTEEDGKVKFEQKHVSKTKPAGIINPMNLPTFQGYKCPDVGNGSGGPM